MLVRAISERAASAIQGWVQKTGRYLLLATFAALFVALRREMWDLLGDGGALAIASLMAGGLLGLYRARRRRS